MNIIPAKEAKRQSIKRQEDQLPVIVNQLRHDIDNAIKYAINRGETKCTVAVRQNQHMAFYILQKEFQSFGYKIDFSIRFVNQVEIDFS